MTDVYGVGPILAAQIIGYTGDVGRFANRDVFASYNGTAPIEWSSGGRRAHRLYAAREPTAQSRSPSGLPHRSVIPGQMDASI